MSVIVPTVRGREESLGRCLDAYERTCPDAEVIVIRDQPTCGIAWQQGADQATGDRIHFTADDLEPLDGWLEAAEEKVPDALPCPVVLTPRRTLQSAGGDSASATHLIDTHVPPDGAAVEFTTVPYMTRDQWDLIGPMIPLHYRTDSWVSHRARGHGIQTVLATGYRLIHHNEPGDKWRRGPQDEIDYRRYVMGELTV